MTETIELPDLTETEVEVLANWWDDQVIEIRDDVRIVASDTELRVQFYQGTTCVGGRYADANQFKVTDSEAWLKWLAELK